MEKPILIGAASCAKAAGAPKAWEKAGEITVAAMPALTPRRVKRWVMFSSRKALISNGYTLAGCPRGPAVSGASMPCFDRPEKGAAGGRGKMANGLLGGRGGVGGGSEVDTFSLDFLSGAAH